MPQVLFPVATPQKYAAQEPTTKNNSAMNKAMLIFLFLWPEVPDLNSSLRTLMTSPFVIRWRLVHWSCARSLVQKQPTNMLAATTTEHAERTTYTTTTLS